MGEMEFKILAVIAVTVFSPLAAYIISGFAQNLLKLIKLEENLNSGLYEVRSLTDRVKKLEELFEQFKDAGESEKINGLLERLEDKIACRILVKVSEENKLPELLERLSRLEKNFNAGNDQL